MLRRCVYRQATDNNRVAEKAQPEKSMSNLAYRQPIVNLPPNRLLVRAILGHESFVTSVAFFGEKYDRVISGSYDELAKVRRD